MLFRSEGFNEGNWESGLRPLIKSVISTTVKEARDREWRGRWHSEGVICHWIQFEPVDWPKANPRLREKRPPTFAISKPTVLVWRDVLYAGFYVERGFRDCPKPDATLDDLAPYMQLQPDWHWHSFLKSLELPKQPQLVELMERLPEENRCIGFLQASGTDRENCNPLPYQDASSTLGALELLIGDCEPNDWIDLIIGSRFTLDECLQLQEGIVDKLRQPLTLALTIERLLLS